MPQASARSESHRLCTPGCHRTGRRHVLRSPAPRGRCDPP
ncbi:gallidermin family lantibiotic [Kocuria sp. CPCC 205235]